MAQDFWQPCQLGYTWYFIIRNSAGSIGTFQKWLKIGLIPHYHTLLKPIFCPIIFFHNDDWLALDCTGSLKLTGIANSAHIELPEVISFKTEGYIGKQIQLSDKLHLFFLPNLFSGGPTKNAINQVWAKIGSRFFSILSNWGILDT